MAAIMLLKLIRINIIAAIPMLLKLIRINIIAAILGCYLTFFTQAF